MIGRRRADDPSKPRGMYGESAMSRSCRASAKHPLCSATEFIEANLVIGVTASNKQTDISNYNGLDAELDEDSTDVGPCSEYDSPVLTSAADAEFMHEHNDYDEFIGCMEHARKYTIKLSELIPTDGFVDEVPRFKESVHAGGGGRGAYTQVDGDLPACFSGIGGRPSTQPTEDHGLGQSPSLSGTVVAGAGGHVSNQTETANMALPTFVNIWHKNCRSLKSDDRVEELEAELDANGEEWAAIMLNETWREDVKELWSTKRDNVFFGSGCSEGRKGTGILLNAKWKRCIVRTVAVSPRLCYIDLKNAWVHKIRLIAAYFPDSSYSDAAYQEQLDAVDEIVADARKHGIAVLLATDLNAQLGDEKTSDGFSALGRHGLGLQNSRGQWAASWASGNHLKVLNTIFRKHHAELYTYTSPAGAEKQLDYILVDKTLMRLCTNSEACDRLGLGSDHRAVFASFRRKVSAPKSKPKRMLHSLRPKWPPDSVEHYSAKLDQLASDVQLSLCLDAKCAAIEDAIIDAMQAAKQPDLVRIDGESERSVKIVDLIAERRALPHSESAARAKVSKVIMKEIKLKRREEAESKIQNLLSKFAGLNAVSGIKSRRRKLLITEMTDEAGSKVDTRKGIADIFAQFYGELYESKLDENLGGSDSEERHAPQPSEITPFSMQELTDVLRSLKRNKGKDSKGIVAEMYKHGGLKLKTLMLDTINQAAERNAVLPSEWKRTRISVLFKSGDVSLAKNYRPISMLSILYKIFSNMISRRLSPLLDAEQCADQAGFRKDYSTTDHLAAATTLIDKAQEWNSEVWIAAVDFMRAFDSIEHHSIWQALREQNVPEGYVALLRRLYAGQTGTVVTDVQSESFRICRGTKQGDPLSTLLFNAVLESIFRRLKQTWARKKFGLELSTNASRYITNLRFADDVLLFARTRRSLQIMIKDLQTAAAETGLHIHPEKSKVITNGKRAAASQISITGGALDVLPDDEPVKYLGKKIAMTGMHETELNHRISAAWACFNSHRAELTNKTYALKNRLKLFSATVTATALYGCETWTLKTDQQKRLRATQRKMLRMILGAKRRVLDASASSNDGRSSTSNESSGEQNLEAWPDFLKRTTRIVDAQLKGANLDEWVTLWRKRQWRWAGKVVQLHQHKWSYGALCWQPVLDCTSGGVRAQARPRRRWDDDIKAYLDHGPHWVVLAADWVRWRALEGGFLDFVKL